MTYKISVTVDIHELGEVRVAAKSSKLGLTAYGSTDEEAIDNYTKLMLAVLNHKGCLNLKESSEALESYLERHGVDWWRDERPALKPQIVDRGARGKGAVLVVAA